ncbi:MAG: ATP-binding cassette, subfamily bacterial [Actinomycetota bacterium]
MLWRLRGYVRPHAGLVTGMVITAIVGLGAGTLIPLVSKAVVDGPVRRGDAGAIVPLAGLALALGAFDITLAVWRRFVQARVAMDIETNIRNDLYAHLQRLSVGFHDRWQSGQLLSRAMSDASAIRRLLGFGAIFFVGNATLFLAVVVMLVRLHAGLAALAAVTAIPIAWLSLQFERRYSAVSRQVQDDQGDLTTHIEEAATGIRVIKAFGRRQYVADSFGAQARVLRDSSMDAVRVRARFWSLLGVVPNLAMAATLVAGALLVGRGSLTLGGLVAFVTLLFLLVFPLQAQGWILAMAEEAASAATRIFEILDDQPEIRERPGAVALATSHGHLRFEDVGFAYPGQDHAVLRHVDLDVAPGETVALVGMSGSGKTTLATLVPRLYDVTAGRVTLDGHDVRDLTLSSLRRHVGVAFEDPLLFSASVRENLLLGSPDASDEDLDRALEVAQAGFARDLPWGLDTRVGEQGLSLSGGQRQRLALARAIIGRPRVLVLDDPLSALDIHTESQVEEALARVLHGTTALIVVHRPSTVALADRVALLEDGTIVATGTHHDLLEQVPAYRAVLSQEAEGRPEAELAG